MSATPGFNWGDFVKRIGPNLPDDYDDLEFPHDGMAVPAYYYDEETHPETWVGFNGTINHHHFDPEDPNPGKRSCNS